MSIHDTDFKKLAAGRQLMAVAGARLAHYALRRAEGRAVNGLRVADDLVEVLQAHLTPQELTPYVVDCIPYSSDFYSRLYDDEESGTGVLMYTAQVLMSRAISSLYSYRGLMAASTALPGRLVLTDRIIAMWNTELEERYLKGSSYDYERDLPEFK